MPNIASMLKEEISRLARKEVRAETEALKRAAAKYRSDIAVLKREIASLQKTVNRAGKRPLEGARENEQDEGRFRFSAKGLASHRHRLGLSAQQFATLVGVTAQSIYKWEAGKARPRESQLPAIAAVRSMGRREAAKRLATP